VAGDGYSQTLSLEDATADRVFLAHEVNGETLPAEHGYPLRLVVRHQYGSKWVKWVERIEVMA
jgi:sulfoxide reductase catalytic subunit YedY